MFDVSFSELLVIALVALVVIGPEKLPKVARMLGGLVGRVQRYMADLKVDIERDSQFRDLQQLQNEIRDGLTQTKAQLDKEMASVADSSAESILSGKSSLVELGSLVQPGQATPIESNPSPSISPNTSLIMPSPPSSTSEVQPVGGPVDQLSSAELVDPSNIRPTEK